MINISEIWILGNFWERVPKIKAFNFPKVTFFFETRTDLKFQNSFFWRVHKHLFFAKCFFSNLKICIFEDFCTLLVVGELFRFFASGILLLVLFRGHGSALLSTKIWIMRAKVSQKYDSTKRTVHMQFLSRKSSGKSVQMPSRYLNLLSAIFYWTRY